MAIDNNTNPSLINCAHRDHVKGHDVCTNMDDIVHLGEVTIVTDGFCSVCPYIKPNVKQDFFTATSSLLVRKQRRGEILAAQRPCGGCTETKHRPPKPTGPTMQFVWPYWEGGAMGDELRFSMRSVDKFFDGNATMLVIGDKPSWYTGPHIGKKRVNNRKPWQSFRDTLSKLYFMATKPEVNSEFVWMMDDVYFLKPFTLEDVQQPRAYRWTGGDKNGWQKLKNATMERLQSEGHTTYDFATHLPHYVEKQKLAEMYEKYDLHNNTHLWEVIYGNLHRNTPSKTRPFFCRIQKPRNIETLRNLTRKATVLNHTSEVWGPEMRAFLMSILTSPSSVEMDSEKGILPTFAVKRRPVRKVKRRPKVAS